MTGGRLRGQAGTGLIASVVGVAVFLTLLLLAVQVLFDLYARSAVGSAAFDAARIVAGSDAGATPAARADATTDARGVLGRYGSRATFAWQVEPDAVELTVSVDNPSLLPAFLSGPLGLDHVERTVVVRRERVRA
ncbi:MAG: hypothetical protein ACRD0L_09930 [Acidimicrobiales bacterium]